MKIPIIGLSVLLAAQVALAYVLRSSEEPLADQPVHSTLLPVSVGDITRMVITGSGGDSTVLERDANGWILLENGKFPAKSSEVETLLNRFATVSAGSLVALSEDASRRFHVSEDLFERKIEFRSADGNTTVLYLGTSQGARQIHARLGDQVGVVRVPLSIWKIPAHRDKWIQTTLLQVSPGDVQALRWGDVHVQRREKSENVKDISESENGNDVLPIPSESNEESSDQPEEIESVTGYAWQMVSRPDRMLPDEPVDRVIRYLSRLLAVGIVSQSEQNLYDQDSPVFSLRIDLHDGSMASHMVFTVFKSREGDQYALQTPTLPGWVKIPTVVAERLAGALSDPIFLVQPGEMEAEAAPGGKSRSEMDSHAEKRGE